MNDPIGRVQEAMRRLGAGEPVVLAAATEDSDGHLIAAAQLATTPTVAYLVRHGSGLVFAALTEADCENLSLPPMAGHGSADIGVEYMVSVDAVDGIGTGISAADRATTLRRLAAPTSRPGSFCRPGHVIPTRAHPGGVLRRRSPTEAAVDLIGMAGLHPAGALTALVSRVDPTSTAGVTESVRFAQDEGLQWVSVSDVVAYRRATESHVQQTFTLHQDTPRGGYCIAGFRSDASGIDYITYRFGDQTGDRSAIVLQRQSLDAEPLLNAVGEIDIDIEAHVAGTVLIVQCGEVSGQLDDICADIAEVVDCLGISTPVFGGDFRRSSLEQLCSSVGSRTVLSAHPGR